MNRLRRLTIVLIVLSLFVFVQTASAAMAVYVADGGFEGGRPNLYWVESSTQAWPVIVSDGEARTGSWHAWLGAVDGTGEETSVSQTIDFPSSGTVTLFLYMENDDCTAGQADWFAVFVDGTDVFSVWECTAPFTEGYSLIEADLSDFADGGLHTLMIKATDNTGNNTSWRVDDVSIRFDALENGSMEEDSNGDKLPDGWKVSSPSGKSKIKCDKPAVGKFYAYSGSCAFLFVGSGSPEKLTYTYEPENGQAGDSFQLTTWTSSTNAVYGGWRVKVTVIYDNGTKEVVINDSAWYPGGTQPYMMGIWNFTVTGGDYDKIKVQFTYNATSGKVYNDLVRLVQSGPAPAPLPSAEAPADQPAGAATRLELGQ